MNPRVVNILLLIAVVVSVGLFHYKHNDKITQLDRVMQSLTGLKKIIHPEAKVYVEYEQMGVEVFHNARNCLLPIRLIPAKGSWRDTMLHITASSTFYSDSFWMNRGYKLEWQNRDSLYSYYYIIRQH